MSLPKTAAEVLKNHIELEVESLDRIYLNIIQWRLQAENNQAHAFTIPHSHRHEARHPQPVAGLQTLIHQTVLQGKPRAAHGTDREQHA